MIRFRIRNIAVALMLSFLCTQPGSASAQGLINTIPKNQAPLSQTFQPAVTEQMPSGTGKFVIFTREPTEKPNEWDFIAGAWECIPSRPNAPVTKRVEFCHSAGNAEPLLDTLVRDDSNGLYPRFVSLSVDTVNLYDINYRTWEVRCIWQGDRLTAFGLMKNFVFCQDSSNWFRLDVSSGKISKDVPFIPLEVDENFWLVRKVGENSGCWSYDREKEQFVGHFGEVDESQTAGSRSLLSPDGRNRAWILVPTPKAWRGGVGMVGGIFQLQRDGKDEDVRIPVELQVKTARGSGRLIPIGAHLCFAEGGKVEFSATRTPKAKKQRVWSIDLASAKIAETERSLNAQKDHGPLFFDGVPAPDYLRSYLKDLWHYGRSGLAPAFLMHVGILKKQPDYPDCTAGVSPDGRHILYKAKEGRLADAFIYGDLKTKQTVRWAAPAGIKRSDSMEFVWVETP